MESPIIYLTDAEAAAMVIEIRKVRPDGPEVHCTEHEKGCTAELMKADLVAHVNNECEHAWVTCWKAGCDQK